LGYYDYHALAQIEGCRINHLLDGVYYANQQLDLVGEDIFQPGYGPGVFQKDTTVNETSYILFLTGENGSYQVTDITPKVERIMIETSEAKIRNLNTPDLNLFIGGRASVTIEGSKFNEVISLAVNMLNISSSSLKRINFGDEIIDYLKIYDTTIKQDDGPAIFGGWATLTFIESSNISTTDVYPDIIINYLNKIELKDLTDIIIGAESCVSAKVYDSDITFSRTRVERLYNHLDESTIKLTNEAVLVDYITKPPELVVNELTITPRRVSYKENATITALIENMGELAEEEEIKLSIDDEEVESFSLIVLGGETKQIEYQLNLEELGRHTVEIMGKTKSFHVVNPSNPLEVVIRFWPWITAILVILAVLIVFFRYRRIL
jgi:hypothetical protein